MHERKSLQLSLEDKMRALENLPLLANVSAKERRELAEKAHVLSFAGGDVIVMEGEAGLGFYLILSGAVNVRRGGEIINRVEAGGFFGEVSLIEGVPRTADVLADGPTVCLGLLRSDFKRLLVREPRVAMTILEEEGRRLVGSPLV
ncbi:MAG TPA: cyclic nucleotide-binding domain-containing protein, partial [Actinomycetota bacterium]|nr:cyclic nucleotide-binding domain-containing protein [Actinomycetota bacterium]